MSRVIRHTSHLTCHTSHVTRHTSHVTPHTSHVTPHTSHVTRHTSKILQGTRLPLAAKPINTIPNPTTRHRNSVINRIHPFPAKKRRKMNAADLSGDPATMADKAAAMEGADRM
jgi:hypothetical protein